jgi:predicted MarR family transcription regulator
LLLRSAALCFLVHAVTGLTSESLRGLVAGFLGSDYSSHQMTYDLRRLRLHGLIERILHTSTCTLTPDGLRVAIFCTKVRNRALRPLLQADRPPAPAQVQRALLTPDHAVDYVTSACPGRAA